MSNQNTGDKPQITQGEWKHWQDSFGDYLVRNESGCIADVYCNENEPEGTEEANAKMIATAGNLSQKYGSLEAMEQQLIGLKEQHHNDILLAQAASDKLIEAEKQVKDLEAAAWKFMSRSSAEPEFKTTETHVKSQLYHDAYHALKQLLTNKQ